MSLDALTSFQILVAQTSSAMAESEGYLLAGGAALVAQGLSDRPTGDLDFVTTPSIGNVRAARDGLLAQAELRGWAHRLVRDHDTFCRLVLVNDDGSEVLVDLAVDSAPGEPPTVTLIGPSFAAEELAARKVLALFDRAEARDFVDVYNLVQQYDRTQLLARAAIIDQGFSTSVFVQMLATLNRFSDDALPIDAMRVAGVRTYFESWVRELSREE